MAKKTEESLLKLWVLRLYVAEDGPQRSWIERNVRAVCDQHLPVPYQLDVLVVQHSMEAATQDGISVVPCLVRRSPLPVRTIVANFSDLHHIRESLGLLWKSNKPSHK